MASGGDWASAGLSSRVARWASIGIPNADNTDEKRVKFCVQPLEPAAASPVRDFSFICLIRSDFALDVFVASIAGQHRRI